MSFKPSHMSFTHVITYPSVWLPSGATRRVLLLGGDHSQLQHICQEIQQHSPTMSWALYHVPDPQILDTDQTDWLLIQSAHVHECWCVVDSHMCLTWAAILKHVHVIHVSEPYHKLVHWAHMHMSNVQDLILNHTKGLS